MLLLIPAVLSSSKEKPRPVLCLTLYLKVGHLTTGLKFFIGLGATAEAFLARIRRLRSFLAGWLNQVLTYLSQSLWKCAFGTIWLRLAGILVLYLGPTPKRYILFSKSEGLLSCIV